MLTDAQVAFFRTFGFLMLPQAFSPDEMAVIDAEFEDVMAADRAGRSVPGRQAPLGVGLCRAAADNAVPNRGRPHL